jgi:hypothetical protein
VPREGVVEEDVPLDGDGGVRVEGEACGEVDGHGCAWAGEGEYYFVDGVGCALLGVGGENKLVIWRVGVRSA